MKAANAMSMKVRAGFYRVVCLEDPAHRYEERVRDGETQVRVCGYCGCPAAFDIRPDPRHDRPAEIGRRLFRVA